MSCGISEAALIVEPLSWSLVPDHMQWYIHVHSTYWYGQWTYTEARSNDAITLDNIYM